MSPDSSPQSISPSHLRQIWLIRELCCWHTKWRAAETAHLLGACHVRMKIWILLPSTWKARHGSMCPRCQHWEGRDGKKPEACCQPVWLSQWAPGWLPQEWRWRTTEKTLEVDLWPLHVPHMHTRVGGKELTESTADLLLWCARTSWGPWGLLRALPQMRGNGIPSPLQTPGWVLYS